MSLIKDRRDKREFSKTLIHSKIEAPCIIGHRKQLSFKKSDKALARNLATPTRHKSRAAQFPNFAQSGCPPGNSFFRYPARHSASIAASEAFALQLTLLDSPSWTVSSHGIAARVGDPFCIAPLFALFSRKTPGRSLYCVTFDVVTLLKVNF